MAGGLTGPPRAIAYDDTGRADVPPALRKVGIECVQWRTTRVCVHVCVSSDSGHTGGNKLLQPEKTNSSKNSTGKKKKQFKQIFSVILRGFRDPGPRSFLF